MATQQKDEFEQLVDILANRNLPMTVRRLAARSLRDVSDIKEVHSTVPQVSNTTVTKEEARESGRTSIPGGVILQEGDEEVLNKIQPVLNKMQKEGAEITNRGIIEKAGWSVKNDRMIPIIVGRVMSHLGYTHKRRGDRNNRRMVYAISKQD